MLFTSLVAAAEKPPSPSFDQQVSALLQASLPQSTLGMVVIDPETNKIVYARRENDNYYPASNTKLLTASAALQLLGPDFTYETRLSARADHIQDKTINGDLHAVFSGDPSFTSADLTALFQQLKSRQLTHIKGNIIIDDTAFEGSYYAPGWTLDSVVWAYSAPISAIIIDENQIAVTVDKSKKLNEMLPMAKQQLDNPVKISGHVKGVSEDAAKNTCQIEVRTQDNHIHFDGCYAWEKTPTVLHMAIDSPQLLAQQWIEKNLAASNIHLSGKIIFGKAPASLTTLAAKKSPPLKDLLVPVLADSNNVYAESLVKTIGSVYKGQGSFYAGTRAIQEILKNETAENNTLPAQSINAKIPSVKSESANNTSLKTVLLPKTICRIEDGSGQSRYNLISPLALGTLLQQMKQHPHADIYQQALSVGGVSGTLKERMQQEDLKGKVLAKTGGASGTSTLSGYIISRSGKSYIFSIMLNQLAENNYAQTKAFEDTLCLMMVNEPWINPQRHNTHLKEACAH